MERSKNLAYLSPSSPSGGYCTSPDSSAGSSFSDAGTVDTGSARSSQQPQSQVPGATSAPAAPEQKRRRYAAEDDWRRHRELISSLYLAKKLNDVRAIMEAEHGFFATERMYKARFKEWGLGKNVTAAKVQQLIQRVEQHHRRRGGDAPVAAAEVLIEEGQNGVDMRRIQKYMKRKPKGLDKLRMDSQRPLELLRILSQSQQPQGAPHRDGTATAGRGGTKRIPLPVHSFADPLYQHQQPNYPPELLPLSPPSSLHLAWTPEANLPDEILRLLHGFLDTQCSQTSPFHSPALYTPGTHTPLAQPASASPSFDSIQSTYPSDTFLVRDESLLDFTLKFRLAHSLLDEGYTQQGIHTLNLCLDKLPRLLQEGRPVVLLYLLTAAYEATTHSSHPEIIQMLFQHVEALSANVFGEGHPMPEISKRLIRLSPSEAAATLMTARQLICSRPDKTADEPAFRCYSHTVDVTTDPVCSPEEKLRGLQNALAAPDVLAARSPALSLWLDMRVAVAKFDLGRRAEAQASLSQCFSPVDVDYHYSPLPSSPSSATAATGATGPSSASSCSSSSGSSSSGGSRTENRLTLVLRCFALRLDFLKTASDWAAAEQVATDAATLADMTWGATDEVTRRFRAEMVALERHRTKLESEVKMEEMALDSSMLCWDGVQIAAPSWSNAWPGPDESAAGVSTNRWLWSAGCG